MKKILLTLLTIATVIVNGQNNLLGITAGLGRTNISGSTSVNETVYRKNLRNRSWQISIDNNHLQL